jgi:hypothetical protein
MQKSIYSFMLLFLISYTAFGQLEKGTFFLGGGLGYSTSSSSQTEPTTSNVLESANSGYSISPDFGYFLKSNWVVGLSLPIGRVERMTSQINSSGMETPKSRTKSTSFGVAPFVRKYFPVSEVFSFFLQARAGYYQSRLELSNIFATPNTSTSLEFEEFTIDATAGLTYFPKKWLGINLSIAPLSFSAGSSRQEFPQNSVDQTSSGFSLGFDSSVIGLGVNIFIPKK